MLHVCLVLFGVGNLLSFWFCQVPDIGNKQDELSTRAVRYAPHSPKMIQTSYHMRKCPQVVLTAVIFAFVEDFSKKIYYSFASIANASIRIFTSFPINGNPLFISLESEIP